MIDTKTTIGYLKQTVEALELLEDQLHRKAIELEQKNTNLVKDRAELVAAKSAFLTQTATMTAKIEKADKLHALATKMKQQVDQQLEELTAKELALSKREEAVSENEALKKDLDTRKQKIEELEADLKERELVVERDVKLVLKDKEALREKQSFLELQKKAILKKQEKLQKMIEAQQL